VKKGAVVAGACAFLCLLAGLAHGEILEFRFDPDSLVRTGPYQYAYPGLKTININETVTLPIVTLYLEGELNDFSDISIDSNPYDRLFLGNIPEQTSAPRDIQTSIERSEQVISRTKDLTESNIIFNIQKLTGSGTPVYALSLLPVTIDEDGNLVFNTRFDLNSTLTEVSITRMFKAAPEIPKGASPLKANENIYGLPLGMEFVIITSPDLVVTYRRLADYKNAFGISTAIAISDTIFACYEGLDNAEKVREYLKDFYSAGGIYVLLGGDDVNLPVRYLYYYNAASIPTDPYDLMPSDLYFADLTGTWDLDGDGVHGEPSQDAPDLVTELKVGRVPLRDPGMVDRYIEKVINYQTNPGNGDFSYLTRQLFFASDQMRDYPAGGQHRYIAQPLPSYVHVDTLQTVELPDGYDADPINPDGNYGVAKISEGFGIVQIIAHGRVDGFRVKAARYGDWPSSNILTVPLSQYHGCIDNLEPNGKTSMYYSLSCSVGGYDLDSVDHQSASTSFIEGILAAENSGAVAMVGYTRWGWVYSSYFQQESFTEHLYSDADGNPIDAMYLSWLEYPYYRDLIYGQNYYGDPTLKLYLDEPQQLQAKAWPAGQGHNVYVQTSGTGLAGASVSISLDGEILETGFTDESGDCELTSDLDYGTTYEICVQKDGFNVGFISYNPSLVTDIDDDDSSLPDKFELMQNYPNPFNPSTTISYGLPERAEVEFSIYNILGQQVYHELFPSQEAGLHELSWYGTDDFGRSLSSGLYLYRVKAGKYSEIKKMMLVK